MGGNWKCYSQGFDCVEESMWRAWEYCGAGGIGNIRDKRFGIGEGNKVVLDQSIGKRAIWKRSGAAVSKQ